MPPIYRIHPGIGIARLGNNPDAFYIQPEQPAALPIDCDAQGNPLLSPDGRSELRVKAFKDDQGRIKRQAARFQVYVYDDESPQGRPLKLGDPVEGGGNAGTLVDIQWRVYLANKKASWYEFKQLEGEHGYSASHPRRNLEITDPEARQRLIIDPGPRSVDSRSNRQARFDRDGQDTYAPTFPPPLTPHSIDTLGELKTDDTGRLLVLGGHGHSGTFRGDEFGQPRIDTYANNDGWFDDVSDGPVMARLVMFSEKVQQVRFVDVEYPSWVIVGYPRYAPEILDMVTADDVVQDLAIREFADRTDLFGAVGTYDDPQQVDSRDLEALMTWKNQVLDWNPNYRPWFYRDIWPILYRPDQFSYLSNILGQSNFPHNESTRGKFDPDRLSVPPQVDRKALAASERACELKNRSGEIVVDHLHPILLEIERSLRSELRRRVAGFDEFTRSIRPSTRHAEFQAALSGLHDSYPGQVEDLLFDDFKAAVKDAAARFHDAVHAAGDSGTPAEYEAKWQAARAEESPAYQEATDALEKDVDAIIGGLHEKAAARWQGVAEPVATLARGWDAAGGGHHEHLEQSVADLLEERIRGPLRGALQGALWAYRSGKLLRDCKRRCLEAATYDLYRQDRAYLLAMLRQPGQENQFSLRGRPNDRTYGLPLMPLLNGDNPLDNTVPSKFLRLTDYQLFLLRQWASGLFYNEKLEGWADPDPQDPYAGWVNRTGRDLDRGVLSNLLGGAFCPGGEVNWIIRNPSIFREPYRIKADPEFYEFRESAAQSNALHGQVPEDDYASYVETELSQENDFERGLQPGDLTKYMALPWQSDFNECTTQTVDVTYEQWATIDPESENDPFMERSRRVWVTMWWPAHRPLQVFENIGPPGQPPVYVMLDWSRGIPQTNAGDLKMVTAWSRLGFVVLNPDTSQQAPTALPPNFKYISTERAKEQNP